MTACPNCEKLKAEIKKLRGRLDDEVRWKKGNYDAFQELKKKFEKLSVAYCYNTDICNPLE